MRIIYLQTFSVRFLSVSQIRIKLRAKIRTKGNTNIKNSLIRICEWTKYIGYNDNTRKRKRNQMHSNAAWSIRNRADGFLA